jgi:hypothetical protein
MAELVITAATSLVGFVGIAALLWTAGQVAPSNVSSRPR